MIATLARTIRSVAAAIDVEGAFIIAGTIGLTFVAWTLAPLLGVAVASVAAITVGILFAR